MTNVRSLFVVVRAMPTESLHLMAFQLHLGKSSIKLVEDLASYHPGLIPLVK